MFLTLSVCALGAEAFLLLHLPLPWLLGPIIVATILSRIERFSFKQPKVLVNPIRTILGVTIGSAFTPAIATGMVTYISSLVFILPFIGLIGVVGVWYFWKIAKYDKMTAYFSAMPGGLVEMTTIGDEMVANVARVTLTQSTRLFLIVFTLPFIIEWISHVDLGGRGSITPPLNTLSLHDIIGMILLGSLGAWGALRLKVSGAYIIGPMVLSAVVYLSGFIESRPPDEALKLAQLVIGSSIGFVFHGISKQEVFRTLLHTVGYFLILCLLCLFFVSLVHFLFDFPLLSVLLAYSPGGQAEMNLIAIILAVNVPFVALHHVLRLFLVMSIAPLFGKWFKKH